MLAVRIIHRFWMWADTLGHKLRLPCWLMRPICDRYDISLGGDPRVMDITTIKGPPRRRAGPRGRSNRRFDP